VVQPPLASSGTVAPSSEPAKEIGGDRQEEHRPEADPATGTPSTTVLGSASPARASTEEPVRTEITSASDIAGDRAPATNVTGEGTIPPQQEPAGNPLVPKHFQTFLSS
jgi:hypothetical protein